MVFLKKSRNAEIFQITVSWTKQCAGGSLNSPTYELNPKISLELISSTASNLLIKVEASRYD